MSSTAHDAHARDVAEPLSRDAFERALARLPNATYLPATTWTPGTPARCSCGKPPANGKTCAGKHPAASTWRATEAGTREDGDGQGIVFLTGIRSRFFVVDADSPAAVAWLLGQGMPETFRVRSSRGLHFYFALPDFPVQTSSKRLHPEVDVRGEGGIIVAPGSPHPNGGHYAIEADVPLAPAPGWILERVAFELREVESADDAPQYREDEESRIARAVKLLDKEPGCVPGMPGGASAHAMRVIAKAVRLCGLTNVAMVEAALERSTWNTRCVDVDGSPFPWDGHELAHKIDEALHRSIIPWSECMVWWRETLERLRSHARKGVVYDFELGCEVPVIKVTANLHEVVDAGCAALKLHPNVYQRQGKLVQTVKIAGRVDWAREGTADGVPSLREIPSATLACELTRVSLWQRFDARKKDWVDTSPTERIEGAIAKAAHWPGVRPLERIVEAPLMRADGSILQTPGYDDPTAVLYEPGSVEFPPVPEAPTLEDARAALFDLLEPFREFPFASDADTLVPVAAVLTSLAMGALDGENFPCFLFDANVQGTGKTLCADAVSWILYGREAPKQTFPTDDKNELEKILASVALAATPMLCLDNINGEFGGDGLEQRMTCRGVSQFRILATNKTPTLPWRTIVLASGNNVRTTVDMRRRIVRCRLVSKVENPEDRPIERTDLRGYVLENRPRLVVAGLTLLRAYFAAGRPKQDIKPMGNFEKWCEFVASPLKWASGVDVLDARMPEAAAVDMPSAAYGAFLATAVLGKPYKAKELAPMACWDELMGDTPLERRPTRIAALLNKNLERPMGGRQVTREKDTRTGTFRYRVALVE